MNYLDIIIAVLVAWFAIAGFLKGIIAQFFSLLGIFAAIYAAIYFSHFTASLVHEHFPNLESGVTWVSTVLTFLAVWIIFKIIGGALTVFANVFLKTVNKIMGFFLGLIKAVFVVLFLCYFTANITYKNELIIPEEDRKESKIYFDIQVLSEQWVPLFFPQGKASEYRNRLSSK
ncbi:MAG: CvpA family protein [Luteibaculaceae bacterium]